MAALTLASHSFLSYGIESLRPSGHSAKKSTLKSVTSVTASCRPTWQHPVSSQRYQRARQAAAMATTWQAMGCQPGKSFGTNTGARWTKEVPRGRGGNPLEEILSQLAGVKSYQVEEREDGWILRFELPGLSAKDFKVQVQNERVLLIGQPGRTTRVALPGSCHVAGLQARLRFGLLTVTLPRTAPSREMRDVTISEEEDADVAVKSDDVAEGSGDVAKGSADLSEGSDDVAVGSGDVGVGSDDVVEGSTGVGEKDVVAREKGEVGGAKEGKKTEGGKKERDWWKDGTNA